MEGRQRRGEGESTWGLEMNSEAAKVFAHLFSCFFLSTADEPQSDSDSVQEDGEEGRGQQTDGQTDMMTNRQRVRQWGREMRETGWGLQLQYVRVCLQDEAAKNQPISTVPTRPN